jgi:hypothetical protein
MRFHSLDTYRRWENAELGDPNDGEGMFRMQGHQYCMGSGNPVFAWCAALPCISPQRLRLLAQSGNYDCLLYVQNPTALIARIRSTLDATKAKMHMHCAQISYNRGEAVNERALNSQNFHFNVFQKSARFAEDEEYRLSLTDLSLHQVERDYVDIVIGDCSDIVTLGSLP